MFILIALIAIVVSLIYIHLTWNFDYWTKRGVVAPKPKIIAGNYPNGMSQKRHLGYDVDDIYRAYRQDEDFVGIFNIRNPQLLITSPTLMHKIYVDYFRNFHDNEISTMVNKQSDSIFGDNPFVLTGEAWKEKRALLAPGFTMSRIKATFSISNKVCRKTSEFIKQHNEKTPNEPIDAKNLSLRFTSELVTDFVLGIEAGSFTDKPTPISAMMKKLFEPAPTTIVYFILVGFIPFLKKYFKLRIIPKSLELSLTDLMDTAVNLRKSDPKQKDRADFLNYLLQVQEKKGLTTVEMTANAMTLLSDGFETTASVLSHIMLLLGRNAVIQARLYDEIAAHIDENGIIEFDKLAELPYLDACIHESIRIFPPGFFANKLCTEPIVLNSKNGRTVQLQKGDIAVLPLYSVMMDEDYFPNPQEFRPERFFEESVKDLRERGVYYGFSDGPRVCIGMRFALMQLKAILVEILRNFKIHVNSKTRKDNLIDPKQFFTHLDGGVWLDFEVRNK